MKKTLALIAGILALITGAFAQTTSSTEKPLPFVTERLLVGDQAGSDQIFLLSEMDGMGKLVKGAPYTASAVTETTQILGDGNRIVNKTTAFLARDSEGRTRREESFPRVGSLQANVPKAVIISDPVAHIQYMSRPGSPSASEGVVINTGEVKENKLFFHKIEGTDSKDKLDVRPARVIGGGMLGGTVVTKSGIVTESSEEQGASANVTHESLGTQVIEGLAAEGTRDTRTISAGAIGNEKPIVITSERWTSPELQVVVLSKRNDPRFGETVYRLSDITRTEPDPSLFHVPDNVKKDLPALPPK